jgi:GntR family transcriptional regulator
MVQSFVPRYYEIEQDLRAQIAASKPGAPLPSDSELCEKYGVSRMTARSAMQRLAQEGLVVRMKGRGTFVSRQPVGRKVSHLRGFSDEMRERGKTPSSRLVSSGMRTGTEVETRALRLNDSARVVSIDRVRLADGVPMALEYAVLTERSAGALDEDLESTSLHQALVKLGVLPSFGTSVVTAELANSKDAKWLGVDRGAALLVERRFVEDADGVPIEYTESRYVPELFVLNAQFDIEIPESYLGGTVPPAVIAR